jgi:uncharacterized protein
VTSDGSTASPARVLGRLEGLDAARGVAVLGMAVVNYDVVLTFSDGEPGFLRALFDLFQGRAAAAFVLLAGIGFVWLDSPARLVRRALFLGAIGYGWYELWPGDILHHYAVYLLLGAVSLRLSSRALVLLSAVAVALFLVAFSMLDYGADWNWMQLDYRTFWSPVGQVRNQFFNGLHPALPWMAFAWGGMAWAKLDLRNPSVWRLGGLFGALAVSVSLALSVWLSALPDTRPVMRRIVAWYEAPSSFWALEPIPPGPLYVVSALGSAMLLVALCLELAHRGHDAWMRPLRACGRLALTLYVAHILLLFALEPLLGLLESTWLDSVPLVGTALATLAFWSVALVAALVYDRTGRRGPLEAWMRAWAG